MTFQLILDKHISYIFLSQLHTLQNRKTGRKGPERKELITFRNIPMHFISDEKSCKPICCHYYILHYLRYIFILYTYITS